MYSTEGVLCVTPRDTQWRELTRELVVGPGPPGRSVGVETVGFFLRTEETR